jgi:hypothetical protein
MSTRASNSHYIQLVDDDVTVKMWSKWSNMLEDRRLESGMFIVQVCS